MKIELYNLGELGCIQDVAAHLLPPEAWSNVNNMQFDKKGASRARGHEQVFGTLSLTNPEFIFNVPALGASYWMYATLTKVFVYESGVHTNITRQTASVDVDYTTIVGRDWQGTIIGGIPILNNKSDIPQYWPTLSPATKLANLANWPSTLRAKVVKSFGPYLVAMNLTEGAVSLPQAVRWSHKADPGTIPSSWDFTDPVVDAGRLELTDVKGGQILDAALLGNNLIIYKESSTHSFRFIGGADLFSPELILATSGILALHCVTPFDKGTRHFVVTSNDIITHTGTKAYESIVTDRERDAIFSELDAANLANSFVFEVESRNQCYFCYPTTGQTYPNKAAIWNYRENSWTFRDWTGVSVDTGTITDTPVGDWDSDGFTWDSDAEGWSSESKVNPVFISRTLSQAFEMEQGYAFGVSTPTAFLERIGIAIDGKDRQGKPKASFSSVKQINRVWPKIRGTALVTVSVGSQDDIDGTLTYSPSVVFNPQVDKYVDSVATGRLLAIRYEATSNDFWRLEGHDLEIVKLAEF